MLRQTMIAAIEKKKSPEEQFIALNLAYYNFSKTHQAYYNLMFQMDGTNCPKADRVTLQHTSEPIRSLISQLSGRPTTKSLFFNWWSIMHGYVAITQGYQNSDEQEYLVILEEMIGRFIFALKNKG